jgi:hypothetical protein
MKLLIYAGFLYLIGISVIILLKPTLMFTNDGIWKEFGLGRDTDKYTWMPFWLFAIIWAIMSYLFVVLVASSNTLPGVPVYNEVVVNSTEAPINLSNKSGNKPSGKKVSQQTSLEMKPGYYILDAEETIRKGIPKYTYLGPDTPNIIFKTAEVEYD